MCGLGIKSHDDYFWYSTIIGIGLYAYLSGIGFLLVWRTIELLFGMLRYEIVLSTYHSDGKGGMGFVGGLLNKTVLMFASGSVFLPILTKLCFATINTTRIMIITAIAFYLLAIFSSFFFPVYLLHRKISKERDRSLMALAREIDVKHGHEKCGVECYLGANNVRNRYIDVKGINTWPFNASNMAQVMFFVLLPITLFITQIVVIGYLGK